MNPIFFLFLFMILIVSTVSAFSILGICLWDCEPVPLNELVPLKPVEWLDNCQIRKVGDTYNTILGKTVWANDSDGKCKPIEQAMSLKNSPVKCIVTKEKPIDPDIECLDYNLTWVKLDIKDKNTNYKIIVYEEGNLSKIRLNKTKEKLDIVELEINLSDEIHIGEDSTIVTFTSAGGDYREDTTLYNAVALYNTYALLGFETPVLSGKIIDSAILEVYTVEVAMHADWWDNDTQIYGIDNQTWWEGDGVANLWALRSSGFNITQISNTLDTELTWFELNVTNIVKESIEIKEFENVSFFLEDQDGSHNVPDAEVVDTYLYVGLYGAGNYTYLCALECGDALTPWLNVTYSEPSAETQTPTPTADLLNISFNNESIELNASNGCDEKCLIYQDGTNVVNISAFPYNRTGLTNNTEYSFNFTVYNDTYDITESNFSNTITTTTAQNTPSPVNNPPTIDAISVTGDANNDTNTNWIGSWTASDGDSDAVFNTTWFNKSNKEPMIIWDFNVENATDVTGQGRNGVIGDGATYSSTGGVDGSGAYTFDGSDTGNNITDADGENYINGLSAVTAMVWVKSDVIASDNGVFIGEVPTGGDDAFTMRYDDAGVDGGGDDVVKIGLTISGISVQLESSSNAQTTEWQHLAFTWSSGNQIALYINGVLDTPTFNDTPTAGTFNESTTFIVGIGGKDEATTSWNGTIDDVRIYNYTLSANEILSIALNQSHVLNASETLQDEIWQFNVRGSDGTDYSTLNSTTFSTLADGCTYGGSGNWEIDLSDYCIINTDTNLSGNNITYTNTGNVTYNAEIDSDNIPLDPDDGSVVWMGTNARLI